MTSPTIKKIGALIVAAMILASLGTVTYSLVSPTVEQTKPNADWRHNMYLFCHEAFDPKVCIQAGQAFEAGKGGEKDIERAIKMFNRACSFGNELGCTLEEAAIDNNAKTGG
ncbi:MAG: SEL1-like repeat protein [Rhizobiaceae bacterium]